MMGQSPQTEISRIPGRTLRKIGVAEDGPRRTSDNIGERSANTPQIIQRKTRQTTSFSEKKGIYSHTSRTTKKCGEFHSPEGESKCRTFPSSQSLLPMQPKEPIDFNSYSDMEVLYMGVPYPRSKLVDGVWYYRTPDGLYRPFPFQKKVRYRPTATFQGSLLTKKKPHSGEGSV